MRSRNELLKRAREFQERLRDYLDTLTPVTDSDDFAIKWLRNQVLHFTSHRDLIEQETLGKYVHVQEPVLLVTPGTGLTTSIVALYWAWLVASEPVSLGISSHDKMLLNFIDSYFNDDEVILTPHLASLNDDDFQELVQSHPTVIVYGSDATIARFQSSTRPDTRFVGYGSKFSIGLHSGPITAANLDGYFRDLTVYDGLGCLNTSVLYIEEFNQGHAEQLKVLSDRILAHYAQSPDARHFHAQFSQSLFENGVQELTPIFGLRGYGQGTLPLPMGYGTLYVVDLEDSLHSLADDLKGYRRYLSSATVGGSAGHHSLLGFTDLLADVGVQRVCDVGAAQYPSLGWSHDGTGNLTPFVTLLDID